MSLQHVKLHILSWPCENYRKNFKNKSEMRKQLQEGQNFWFPNSELDFSPLCQRRQNEKQLINHLL